MGHRHNIYLHKEHPDAKIPVLGSDGAGGSDLFSVESGIIPVGGRAIIDTGIVLAIPTNYVGLIWPRSKLGAKLGIQVLAGVVDSDYRGSIKVALLNSGDKPFEYFKGDKLAQIIIQPSLCPRFTEIEKLDETERGKEGIDSTEWRLR